VAPPRKNSRNATRWSWRTDRHGPAPAHSGCRAPAGPGVSERRVTPANRRVTRLGCQFGVGGAGSTPVNAVCRGPQLDGGGPRLALLFVVSFLVLVTSSFEISPSVAQIANVCNGLSNKEFSNNRSLRCNCRVRLSPCLQLVHLGYLATPQVDLDR
jgi:hypothetical protein